MTSLLLETVAVAHQETVLATLFIIAAQLTKTLLLVGAAVIFGTVRALIFAALIQGILQTIMLLAYLRWGFPRVRRGFNWGQMRTQLAYSLPLGFSGVLFALQNDMHNYFVSNHFQRCSSGQARWPAPCSFGRWYPLFRKPRCGRGCARADPRRSCRPDRPGRAGRGPRGAPRRQGAKVTLAWQPGGHQLTSADVAAAAGWLAGLDEPVSPGGTPMYC